MTTAEKLRAEGREEGREEGWKAGALRTASGTFMRLLQLKFGAPDAAVQARVESADLALLNRWTDRILTAETLEAVFE